MKSMTQMQNELLEHAKFDGTYPKPVVLPFGILALAKDEEEFTELNRESYRAHLFLAIGAAVAGVVPIGLMVWDVLK